MKAVILAAGLGRRLGERLPKALTPLPDGNTLLGNQINILQSLNIKEIYVVVGFKKEIIMETYPQVCYVYNPDFHITNTAKSLLSALQMLEPDDTVWINGDVYLEHNVIKAIILEKGNAVAVNNAACGEEEVKYSLDKKGNIREISKQVLDSNGEAVGVNKITKDDFLAFLKALEKCSPSDYFEKAIEIAIKEHNLIFKPVNISNYKCLEIDFYSDLATLKKMLGKR